MSELFSYPYSNLLYIPVFFLVLLKFVGIGLFGMSVLDRHLKFDHRILPIYFIFSIGCAGFVFFWIYYLFNILGILLSLSSTVFICTLLFKPTFLRKKFPTIYPLLSSIRQRALEFSRNPDFYWPLLLMTLISCFYLSFLWSAHENVAKGDMVQLRLLNEAGSPDYNIQWMMYSNLMKGKNIWGHVMGEIMPTTVSDRPPLVAGIALSSSFLPVTYYPQFYVTAFLAQLLWVFALWATFRLFGLSRHLSSFWIIFMSQVGFFFFHSLYCWPKFIAGTFVLSSFLVLIQSRTKKEKLSLGHLVVGTVLAMLGVFSHSAVATVLLPMAALLLVSRYRISPKQACLGLTAFILLLAPWNQHKKIHEKDKPQAIRLLLAGYNEPTYSDRSISHFEAMKRAYAGSTWKSYLEQKLYMFQQIWKLRPTIREFNDGWTWLTAGPQSFFENNFEKTRRIYRRVDSRNVAGAFGFFLLAIPLLLCKLIQKKSKRKHQLPLTMILVGVIGILLYIFISFDMGVTVSHVSFASLLMIFSGLAILLSEVSRPTLALLYLANLIYFVFIWCTGEIAKGMSYSVIYSVLCIASFLALQFTSLQSLRMRSKAFK